MTSSLSCGNPLLSPQQFDQLCGQFGLTTADTQTVYIGRRNVEGGFRTNLTTHVSNRIVVGARGEINDAKSVIGLLLAHLLINSAIRVSGGRLDRRGIEAHAEDLIERFRIKARPGDRVATLSGGNIQKVLLARVLSRDPKVVIVSQPTRGLDVGASEYVREELLARRAEGGRDAPRAEHCHPGESVVHG